MGERETDALCPMELTDLKSRGRMAHYGRLAGGRYFSVENRFVSPWRFCVPPLSRVPHSSREHQTRVVDDIDAGIVQSNVLPPIAHTDRI